MMKHRKLLHKDNQRIAFAISIYAVMVGPSVISLMVLNDVREALQNNIAASNIISSAMGFIIAGVGAGSFLALIMAVVAHDSLGHAIDFMRSDAREGLGAAPLVAPPAPDDLFEPRATRSLDDF